MKRRRENGGKCNKKNGRKERENEKRRNKILKQMQNREELRQKGLDGRQKTTCRNRGKKYHFQKGGGDKYCIGPKYRPLYTVEFRRITFYCTTRTVQPSNAVVFLLTSLEYLHSLHVRADLNQVSNRKLK